LPLANPDRQSFRRWLESYRPDVILSPYPSLRSSARGTRFIALEPDPDHLPAATDALLYPSASMADRAVDLLIMSADRNQFGLPPHPTDTAIPGEFHNARARRQRPAARAVWAGAAAIFARCPGPTRPIAHSTPPANWASSSRKPAKANFTA